MGGAQMRIDIGAGGKIIGTKRVSPNGQVSGLREYAGKEVLVILPGEGVSEPTGEDIFSEMQKLILNQMRIAFEQNKWMRERFSNPYEAMQEFMKSILPPNMKSFLEMMDEWMKQQKK
jgi:hypothetical protein